MKIPFVDLRAQYLAHKAEFDAAIHGVIDATAFIGGESVREFEAKFAAACGAKHCIAVANGTDAIYIVLKMLGIGAGDEVISVPMTFIATAAAIVQTGARRSRHRTLRLARIMEYHRYRIPVVLQMLAQVGFAGAELRLFAMRSNGDYHSFFLARKPT